MDNFTSVLSAARVGHEGCTLKIMGLFDHYITTQVRIRPNVVDLKSELELEVLEQIRGKSKRAFDIGKFWQRFENSRHTDYNRYRRILTQTSNKAGYDKFLEEKFTFWVKLALDRLAKMVDGKAKVSVYIPLYVSTATKHYNKLVSFFGSHERARDFIEGNLKEDGKPGKDICRAKEILVASLKHKGRKKLLDRVRILVSEIPFNPDRHSLVVEPQQEFKMLVEEFVLSRPCNLKVGEEIMVAGEYAGEHGCSYRCRNTCGEYEKCWKERRELEQYGKGQTRT